MAGLGEREERLIRAALPKEERANDCGNETTQENQGIDRSKCPKALWNKKGKPGAEEGKPKAKHLPVTRVTEDRTTTSNIASAKNTEVLEQNEYTRGAAETEHDHPATK